MMAEPQFHLTTKDHAIIQTMLERYRGARGPYLALLERKVRESAIYFRDDIPPGVVTINTRLTYSNDGVKCGPCLLVQSQARDLPDYALSVHTLPGLALLGLAERSSITLHSDVGPGERLLVEEILWQPEAAARSREAAQYRHLRDETVRANVVDFVRRSTHPAMHRPARNDDDPCPGAA